MKCSQGGKEQKMTDKLRTVTQSMPAEHVSQADHYVQHREMCWYQEFLGCICTSISPIL